ncbi:MAG: cell division protein ZapA [Clostridia bacterium]|nr:cell division protein ZapA [Clostridia bacterium]
MSRNRTVVRIAGKEYPIVSQDSEMYVQRVARYVDRKITELNLTTRQPVSDCAVLAAVTIADDLSKSRDEINRLRAQMEAQAAELKALREAAQAEAQPRQDA